MGKKKVDIDAILGEDALTLVIKGKEYIVNDVALPVFIKATKAIEDDKDPKTVYSILSELMNISEEDAEELGLFASVEAMKQIQLWLAESVNMNNVSQTPEEGQSGSQSDPLIS